MNNYLPDDFTYSDWLALASLLLPLLSFLVSSFIAEKYAWGVALIATLLLLASAVTSAVVLAGQWSQPDRPLGIDWFSAGDARFAADLMIDNRSALMLFVVALISFLVHLYSIGYMAGDMSSRRYFAMLGFFTFSMQGIVLADSLLLMFVFWELVGFSSYILIGHHMESHATGHAAKKAFVMNRLGDIGFVVGLMIVWSATGTFNISSLTAMADAGWQTGASLCIFCGVIGKSAQFPLFTWLPDAMVGPTPVSALIHAATMVAAGVYLTNKLYPIFTELSLSVVAVTGAVTALLGGLAALVQFDIKRILAYSTVSQLGLMIMVTGCGAPMPAFLHLATHAFFKACLFLCAGSVIQAMHLARHQSHGSFDVQDIRNLGGLSRQLPTTFFAACAGAASLAGIPLFSGYLSKEAMLAGIWRSDASFGPAMTVVALVVSLLTVLYSFRFVWFVFLAPARFPGLHVTTSPLVMKIPLAILAFFCLWLAVSWNPFDPGEWLMANEPSFEVTAMTFVVITAGILAGWFVVRRSQAFSPVVLRETFFIDKLYRRFYRAAILPSASVADYVDRRVIDRAIHVGAYGQVTLAHVVQWLDNKVVDGMVGLIARVVEFVGLIARSIQGGKVQLYIFWSVLAIIIFLICALY